MKAGTRLYDMGGDIVSNFYPSGSAQSSMWPGGPKKKKKVIGGSGRPMKKGSFSGCKKGQCV
jgi:hypothetical protein